MANVAIAVLVRTAKGRKESRLESRQPPSPKEISQIHTIVVDMFCHMHDFSFDRFIYRALLWGMGKSFRCRLLFWIFGGVYLLLFGTAVPESYHGAGKINREKGLEKQSLSYRKEPVFTRARVEPALHLYDLCNPGIAQNDLTFP